MKAQHVLSIVMLLLVAAQVNAGWIIQEKIVMGKDVENVTLYIQKNKMKTADQAISIFDLDQEKIYSILPEQQIYIVMTADAVKNARPQQGDQTERPTKVEVKETDETATIAGYSTKKYEVWVDGALKHELWIAKDFTMADEFETDKMLRLTEKMAPDTKYQTDPEYQALMKLGYPLKQIEHKDGETVETEITKLEKKDIPDSEFQVPAGFKEMNMGSMMGR
jgi:hypothetical protein